MIHFIENEKSKNGNGAAIWGTLKNYLDKEKIPYQKWTTEYPGHGRELAQQICKLQDEDLAIIVLGGDGTANEVINGMSNFSKVRFGIIPVGSGNDLARGLGIRGNPLDILKKMLESKEERKIDLGRVSWNRGENSRLFAISSGVGMDALVCKKAITSPVKKYLNKIHLGKLSYLVLTVQSLFSMTTADARITMDGTTRDYNKVIFSAVMNFRTEGGGVPMVPTAKADDGMLSSCTVNGIPKWKTFFVLPFLVAARHYRLKGVTIGHGKEMEIHSKVPLVLHADGEYLGDVTAASFSCIPAVLRIMG